MAALEKLSIDTPEQIDLEFSLATIGSRFLALALDTLLQVVIAAALLAVIALVRLATGPFGSASAPWLLAILIIGWFTVYYGYYAIFESVWNGQTPGKRVVGLRVIHASGRPISTYEAILRNVVRIVDQLPGIYAIGIVSVFVTERSQRLGDLAAGTVVVHERLSEAEAPVMELSVSSGNVPRHGAARLTQDEIHVIEMFLRRRRELDGAARVHAAQRIADRMRQKLGIAGDTDNERLLEELLSEHRSSRHYG